MKSGNKKLLKCACMFFIGTLLVSTPMVVAASEGNSVETLNAGAAVVLEADISMKNEDLVKLVETVQNVQTEQTATAKESKLVMADVVDSANVRKEANEEAGKIGKLYKDCGGEILERSAGWSKIKSGDVVGWVNDDYLLFGTDAERMAQDVGHLLATVEADAIRVRKENSDSAEVLGVAAQGEKLDVIEEGNGWVTIDYEGNKGYVQAQYVSVDFKLDQGETMEVIQERERKEAAEKAKRAAENTANRGAVPAGTSDVELLAALIQCEAGGEAYEGQLAVGAVVMNRVRSGGYPNTIGGVIYASGQFTPALNGKVATRIEKGVKASCIQAAQESINGTSNVGGATHFRRAGSKGGLVIGNHVFW